MIDPRSPDYSNTPADPRRPRFGYAPPTGAPNRDTQPTAQPTAQPTSAGTDPRDADTPVVSVVTPFFNPGAEFAQTAACVLGQSLQRFEWIIVNDASTDAASLAALEPLSRDPRVRIITLTENKGPGHARNVGFRAARAPHVYQLDADDLIEPTTLEKQAWAARCQPLYSFFNAFLVGFGGIQYLWTEGFQSLHMLTSKNPLSTHALISKAAFEQIGGYDESITGGLEDWEFWLRAASKGFWGATIPEFQSWYRRRPSHADRWKDWDEGTREREFVARMRPQFPALFDGRYPHIEPTWPRPYEDVRAAPVFDNPLEKTKRRLLLIVPWLRMGGADKWNLDLVEQLTSRGWEVTIAATLHAHHTWLPDFARLTPDIFCMGSFLRPAEFPVFLRYLIESRRPDVVLVSNSEMGYLSLPYLRAYCSDDATVAAIVEYMHRTYSMEIGPNTAMRVLIEHGVESQARSLPSMEVRGRDAVSGLPRMQVVSAAEVAALRKPRPLFIDYLHMEEPQWKNGGYPRYSVGAHSQLDLSMVTSDHLKGWMTQRGAEEDRVRTVYINCDPQRWRPDAAMRERVRAELDIPADRCVILFAGRLTEQKQPKVFAKTMHALAQRNLEFTALVAGDGEDRAWVEDYISSHRLRGHVRLLGEASAPRVRELMAAADIFFLPSLWEGIALVLFEAMAAELAFVGADVGGQRELAIPGTAILLPRADEATEVAGYADALARLIADPAERRRMGQAAAERIRAGFTLDRMGDEFLAGIQQAESLRRTAPRQAVPLALGHELAVHAVEYMRATDQNSLLIHERDSLVSKLADASSPFTNIPAPDPHHDPAVAELAHITASRAWRLLQSIKTSPVYSAYARVRFGAGWNHDPRDESPPARLARIKASRSYRWLQSLKRTGAYKRYARRRYGERHSG